VRSNDVYCDSANIAQVKLIDFGFLKELPIPDDESGLDLTEPSFDTSDIVELDYISPEMRELKKGTLTLEQLKQAGISVKELLTKNDVWMLGHVLYYLVCRPQEDGASRFFAKTYTWSSLSKFDALGPLNTAKAAQRLDSLDLDSDKRGKLRQLLFEKILVPVQQRVKDADAVASALAELGKDLLEEGQAELQQIAWPFFLPGVNLHRPPKDDSDGKAYGGGSTLNGLSPPLFEADITYVKVMHRMTRKKSTGIYWYCMGSESAVVTWKLGGLILPHLSVSYQFRYRPHLSISCSLRVKSVHTDSTGPFVLTRFAHIILPRAFLIRIDLCNGDPTDIHYSFIPYCHLRGESDARSGPCRCLDARRIGEFSRSDVAWPEIGSHCKSAM
jgi:serine/threonine protein kinase